MGNDIINYVMQSPDNTNPNVLRGLLNNINSNIDIFVVTITETGSGRNATYSSDKTFNEIAAAYNAGKYITADFKWILDGQEQSVHYKPFFVGLSSAEAWFCTFTLNNTLIFHYFKINNFGVTYNTGST